MSENTDLIATSPPTTLAVQGKNEAAAAFLSGNTGKRANPMSLPIIHLDHKEGTFTLPNGEVTEAVSGYPIYVFQTRRYYKKPPKPGEQGQRPDCFSMNMVTPSKNSLDAQSDECGNCPHAEFGTARDGRGQSCSTQTWIFLINPAFGEPPIGVVVFPPSSIKTFYGNPTTPGYLGKASARHGAYEIVWTTIHLKKMGDQVQFCVAEPVMGAPANMERAMELRAIKDRFYTAMEGLRGSVAEEPAKKDEEETE